MTLSLKETMGILNERALMLAARLLSEQQAEDRIIQQIRLGLVMPAFHGNLLAVRLTDQQKVQRADVPAELQAARALLLRALTAEILSLEPTYKERLANSHK